MTGGEFRIPSAEITGHDEQPLMYADVQAVFDRTKPPTPSATADGSLPAEQPTRDDR